MKVETQRLLLLVVIAILVITEVAKWLASLFGMAAGGAAVLLTILIYGYCAKRAKASVQYYAWILIPTVLFSVVPAVIEVRRYMARESEPFINKFISMLPTIFGFILPLCILLVLYFGIKKKEE